MKKFKALPGKDIKNNSLHRWLTFYDQNVSDYTLKEMMAMDTAIYKAKEKMKARQERKKEAKRAKDKNKE